jgi:hypothetical protein
MTSDPPPSDHDRETWEAERSLMAWQAAFWLERVARRIPRRIPLRRRCVRLAAELREVFLLPPGGER